MLAVGEDILAGVDTLLGTEAGFGTPAKVREERRRHDEWMERPFFVFISHGHRRRR